MSIVTIWHPGVRSLMSGGHSLPMHKTHGIKWHRDVYFPPILEVVRRVIFFAYDHDLARLKLQNLRQVATYSTWQGKFLASIRFFRKKGTYSGLFIKWYTHLFLLLPPIHSNCLEFSTKLIHNKCRGFRHLSWNGGSTNHTVWCFAIFSLFDGFDVWHSIALTKKWLCTTF